MQKLWSYSHFKALATVWVRVPVTEPGIGAGDRAWYWFRYRYRISLVVPVPVRNSVPVGS